VNIRQGAACGRRLRVLVVAYACEPGRGSEPAVGWNSVKQIARFNDVWVITRANNRQAVERQLEVEPMPNVRWAYFDLPRWTSFWKRGQRGIHVYYYLWQVAASVLARRLNRVVGFDVAHHVTFCAYWLPSCAALSGARRFVWGPVGGGESTPGPLRATFSHDQRLRELIRSGTHWFGSIDPLVRLTVRRADVPLATTKETARQMSRLGARAVRVCSQVGAGREETEALGSAPVRREAPFRLMSMGKLVQMKGFHLGLAAFARLQDDLPTSEYWIVGAGPERARLQRLSRRLGVEGRVRWYGRLPREQALAKLAECDVLVHPSLHDSGGFVCVEAMAAGKPVVCLDLGGPSVLVDETSGVKVPACTPDQTTADLAAAILRLGRDPDLRASLGDGGRRRVDGDLAWDQKGERMQAIYREALGSAWM
jgi:glycosyltransferase involved in cell wall biosynthesis